MSILSPIRFAPLLVTIACSSVSDGGDAERVHRLSSPLSDPGYVDAASYFTEPADIDDWYALTRALKADFDAICGDTFCEGDYSNYESLGFRCSVEQNTGALGSCVWTFAASQDEIDTATGAVTVAGEIWSCPMPLASATDASAFLRTLSSSEEAPLHTLLPGSERSLYDGLLDCL